MRIEFLNEIRDDDGVFDVKFDDMITSVDGGGQSAEKCGHPEPTEVRIISSMQIAQAVDGDSTVNGVRIVQVNAADSFVNIVPKKSKFFVFSTGFFLFGQFLKLLPKNDIFSVYVNFFRIWKFI